MEGGSGETPLEVLSRAATMVQENRVLSTEDEHPSMEPHQLSPPSSTNGNGISNSNNKQLPTAKWKRDRRSKLPEYSRKSNATADNNSDEADGGGGVFQENAPLDMSVKQRGSPPSYAQTVSNPNYRSSYRPSVIHNNGGAATSREDLPPGISMCDPIIDEHFRRSLGKDYMSIFSTGDNPNAATNGNSNNGRNAKKSSSPPPSKPQPQSSNKAPKVHPSAASANVIELMDTAGLSVDDHFAKALGDTWLKLNKNNNLESTEKTISGGENGHSLVTI